MSEKPCDTEEPTAEVRSLFCKTRHHIKRFQDAKVADLEQERRKRLVSNQPDLDLQAALSRLDVRSADAGGYDDDGDAA